MFKHLSDANKSLIDNFSYYFLNILTLTIWNILIYQFVNRSSGFLNLIFLIIQYLVSAYLSLGIIESIVKKRVEPSSQLGDLAQFSNFKYPDRRYRSLNLFGSYFIVSLIVFFMVAIGLLIFLGSSIRRMGIYGGMNFPSIGLGKSLGLLVFTLLVLDFFNIFWSLFPYLALGQKKYDVFSIIKGALSLTGRYFPGLFIFSSLVVSMSFVVFFPILLGFFIMILGGRIQLLLFSPIFSFLLAIYLSPLISIFKANYILDLLRRDQGLKWEDFLAGHGDLPGDNLEDENF